MHLRFRLALTTVLVATLVAIPAHAQQDTDPLASLRSTIREAADDPADSDARERLDAELEALLAEPKALTREQFLSAGQSLFRARMSGRCAALAELGVEVHPDDAGLFDLLGRARFTLCQQARTDAEMRQLAEAAAQAFSQARATGVMTPPAHVLVWQAHLISCRFAEALADFDRVRQDERFAAQLPDRHLVRGMLLLGLGKGAEALAELDHEELDPEMRAVTEQMAIRALALTGEVKAAAKRAQRLWSEHPSPETMAFYADVLGADRRYDEALALLAEHPVVALESEPESLLAQRQQSRRTFGYLLELRGELPKDFRARLAEHLGHGVVIAGAADDPQSQLSSSPLFVGYTVRQAPSSTKGWGNDLLFQVCVAAAASHEPSGLEAALLPAILDEDSRRALTGEGAEERAMQILRGCLLREDFEGVLTALQLAEQL